MNNNEKSKNVLRDALLNTKCFSIIAGPCAIEDKIQLDELAARLKEMDIHILRGGAYKMRTSPYSYRGLGEVGLSIHKEIGEKYNMLTVSECIDINKVEMMSEIIDVLLIGTRNMQNYPLLEALGKVSNPVILKRGMCSTYQEWLFAAQYIIESGNPNVVLCERGIRTFENHTRNTLDLSAIPSIQFLSDLPIIIDPSHSTGSRKYIKSMTWAAVAAGANGVMIETHIDPDKSICDADQSVSIEELETIIKPIPQLRNIICH